MLIATFMIHKEDLDVARKAFIEEKVAVVKETVYEHFTPQVAIRIRRDFAKPFLKILIARLNSVSSQRIKLIRVETEEKYIARKRTCFLS